MTDVAVGRTVPRHLNCRILYLIGQLHSGGSERQLFYLLQNMDRHFYRPAVAVWNVSEDDTYLRKIQRLGVPTYSFQKAFSGASKLVGLRRLVKELEPEIVHSFSFYLNVAAHLSVRGTTAIDLGSMRSALHLDKKINGWLLSRLSARWPRTQIYNSYEAARCASTSKGPFLPGRVVVVRNGVDLEGFSSVPLSVHKRPRVLGVGSLLPVKRWDRLLRAAQELKRRRLDFSVRIVGGGPLQRSLEADALNLGISDCVEFEGYSAHIPSQLADATFLVHPSDAEGCPNVLMEAMACGRAIVATDVGDASSLIEDGHTGFVVRRGDDATLVERMATLISDYHLCKRMGEAGRARAEREFGLDRMVSDTLAVYGAAQARQTLNDRSGIGFSRI